MTFLLPFLLHMPSVMAQKLGDVHFFTSKNMVASKLNWTIEESLFYMQTLKEVNSIRQHKNGKYCAEQTKDIIFRELMKRAIETLLNRLLLKGSC